MENLRRMAHRASAIILPLVVGLVMAGEATGASASETPTAPTAPTPATSEPAKLLLSVGHSLAAPGDLSLAFEYQATVNALRQSRGLQPLSTGPRLMREARKHSRKMARQNRLVHSHLERLLGGGIHLAGENVGTGVSVAQVHQAFLQSPGHAGNLLSGKWRQTGIGVYQKGGRVWITQIFAG
jgi:uncharacterized protein YkwD